ncbi:MAG: gamma-glutamylcyclotransferase family protein [Desulfuromonadaceae bacterium]
MAIKRLLHYTQRKKILYQQDVAQTDVFFFYGSLMERYTNFNRFIKRKVTSLHAGYCRGYLYYLPMGFPALIYPEDPCTSLVAGELMTFHNPARAMRLLDRLEQYNPLSPHKSTYIRKKLPVIVESEDEKDELKHIEAWVYTYPEDHLSNDHQRQVRIECGQWASFRSHGQPEKELAEMTERLRYCDRTQSILVDPAICIEPVLRSAPHLYGCERFCDKNNACLQNRRTIQEKQGVDFPAQGCPSNLSCSD